MFGFGKSPETEKLVGAREKLLKAQKYSKGFQVKSKREGKEPSPVVGVIIIYALSVGLAAFMTQDVLKQGLNIDFGGPTLKKLLFGPGEPSLTGGQDVDFILTIALRGLAIFLLAGFLPFATFAWQRLLDRSNSNAYIAFWSVSVGVFFVYFAFKMMMPMFDGLLAIAS